MDRVELITKARGSLEQCRRLAKLIDDPRTTKALLLIADEVEADIKRAEAEVLRS